MFSKQPSFNHYLLLARSSKRKPKNFFAENKLLLYLISLSLQLKNYPSLLQQTLVRSLDIFFVYCQSILE